MVIDPLLGFEPCRLEHCGIDAIHPAHGTRTRYFDVEPVPRWRRNKRKAVAKQDQQENA